MSCDATGASNPGGVARVILSEEINVLHFLNNARPRKIKSHDFFCVRSRSS